jgi:hypothetical protein
MKALIRRAKFVVGPLFALLACTSSFVEAQSMRIRNAGPSHVAPMPMRLAMPPASVPAKTMSPTVTAKMPSSVTTPRTTTTPSTTPTRMTNLTQSQLQALEQRRLSFAGLRDENRVIAGEDLFLLARLAAGINGYNPYATTVNPYANPYGPTVNPYAGTGTPANSSGGYAAGSTYSSSYYINPYDPYASNPYSSLNPNGGYGNIASPAVLPTQDSKTQTREVLGGVKEMSTLLTGLGVPNSEGRIVWPKGLDALRPDSESRALRQQVSVDFRIVVSQLLAGTENATFVNQGNVALARLDVLLRENEKSVAPAVYSEAKQFLGKLRQALQVLQPGSAKQAE